MKTEKLDLTTVYGVKALMSSSKNEEEWNFNCDLIKKANDGYPSFWWSAIMLSGIAERTTNLFKTAEEVNNV